MEANAPQEGSNGAPSKPGGTTKQTQDEVGKALEHQMAIAFAASLETEQQEAEARQESTVDALSDMVAKTRKITVLQKRKMIQNILSKPLRDNFDGKDQVEAAKALLAAAGGNPKIRSNDPGWNGFFVQL